MKRNVAVIPGVVVICTAVSTVITCEGKGDTAGDGMQSEMMQGGKLQEYDSSPCETATSITEDGPSSPRIPLC